MGSAAFQAPRTPATQNQLRTSLRPVGSRERLRQQLERRRVAGPIAQGERRAHRVVCELASDEGCHRPVLSHRAQQAEVGLEHVKRDSRLVEQRQTALGVDLLHALVADADRIAVRVVDVAQVARPRGLVLAEGP